MDPLALLRESCIAGTLGSISETDDRIQFGNRYSFPKDVPTAYKSQQGGQYTLSTLLFFLKSRGLAGGQYIAAATKAGIPSVGFRDRKDVEAYLTGASDRSDSIALTAPDLLPLQPPLDAPDQAAGAAEPAAKRARTDAAAAAAGEPEQAGDLGEEAALADLLSRERQLRDRNSQLLVPHKSFRSVLQILDQAQKKQSEKERERTRRGEAAAPRPSSKKEALPVLPSRRFERPTAEGLKAMGIDEFGGQKIDAYGARKPAAPPAAGASTRQNGATDDLPPPPPPPDGKGPPPPPLQRPAVTGKDNQPPPAGQHRSSSSGHKHRPPTSGRPGSQSGHHHADKRRHEASSSARKGGGVPIILVPSAATATLNMLNAKAFLEECVYRLPQQAEEEGAKKASAASFSRTIGRAKPVVYHITERAPKPGSSDWHRVVAVFVTGQTWQFKGWPHKGAEEGDLALALSCMLGVYVGLKGEDVPANVKKWNLLKVEVPKDNRHRDRPIVQDIFAALDKFLGSRQTKLAY